MITVADQVRERIQTSFFKIQRQGDDLISEGSERAQALWMEIDASLKAADLCELLCEDRRMRWHLETVNMLLKRMEA